ncbi:MAG: aldehyde ferredoxin oxidoreductase [Anaerolineales bacterium]|jgi:aldehyde:ferredoxin oxidoreductase|nr:aldehyde ferredoxin oxidoreductase [Anaerolineales bacterium]
MNVWRVNVREQSLQVEPLPPTWERLGGRGLIARILVDEVPGTCEPLGRFNKLIFTPGLLVGHMLSSCDRISVGGKSPLTGGVKEANAGGTTGLQMAYLGIRALILEDKPEKDAWWVMVVSAGGVHFEPAGDLAGLGVTESAKRLVDRYGEKVALSLIGPGGEMLLSSAGIQNLDKDHAPTRIAARGGLGAMMGSKRIKAIVFDASGGVKPPLVDAQAFKEAQKIFTKALMAHPQVQIFSQYGTAANARMTDGFGSLPTRNFSSGRFEGLETISGEYMRQVILERGGEGDPTHACMPGCTIRCSNCYAGEDGKAIVSPLEYETIGLMGTNLGIDSLDVIGRLNWEVNDLGLDSIEIGAALGVAAEAGLMQFGDGERAMALLHEIRQGTPLGRILGSGATITGKVFGVLRVPAVKGQAMSAYEPRAIKGTGVTYATSPQGADHTSGLTVRAKVNHLDPVGQAALSRTAQINMAGYDTLGACSFASYGFVSAPESVRDLINARYGWGVGTDFLQVLGRESLKLEREFNRSAGFTQAHDRMPEYMKHEPVPPYNPVFDVPDEDLDAIFDW